MNKTYGLLPAIASIRFPGRHRAFAFTATLAPLSTADPAMKPPKHEFNALFVVVSVSCDCGVLTFVDGCM